MPSYCLRLLQYGSPSQYDRTKRRALVIADNMCKLVPDVTEIQPFLPTQGDPRVENEGRKSQVLLKTLMLFGHGHVGDPQEKPRVMASSG